MSGDIIKNGFCQVRILQYHDAFFVLEFLFFSSRIYWDLLRAIERVCPYNLRYYGNIWEKRHEFSYPFDDFDDRLFGWLRRTLFSCGTPPESCPRRRAGNTEFPGVMGYGCF
jgi:hypothetical protein